MIAKPELSLNKNCLFDRAQTQFGLRVLLIVDQILNVTLYDRVATCSTYDKRMPA